MLAQPKKLQDIKLASYTSEEKLIIQKLQQCFIQWAKLKSDTQYYQYLANERAIYAAVLIHKSPILTGHIKLIQQFFDKFQQLDQSIIKRNSDINEKQIKKFREKLIKQYSKDPEKLTKISKEADLYICQVIRSICKKKDESSIFSLIVGKTSCQYDKKDIKQIGAYFIEQIIMIKFEQKWDQNFKYNDQSIYILKKEGSYFLLKNKIVKKQRQKSQIKESFKIIDNKKIQANDIQKIFSTQQNYRQINQTNKEKINSKLFPSIVVCSTCQKKVYEYDTIKWNYMKYCEGCVLDPKVNTSSIPANLIKKFLKEQEKDINQYCVICPECQSISHLKRYDPTNKPKKFTCQTCDKTICLQHSVMVKTCFCYCLSCRSNTISLQHINLNVCQKCQHKQCLKCLSFSKKFCKCICKQCLTNNSDSHNCKKKCHMCMNNFPNLRQCRCQLYICSGCYYLNYKLGCEFTEYI